MHFAAFIEVGESMKDPAKFLRNNLINSLSLIEAAARARVPCCLLSSTAAVYQSSEDPLTEASPLGPTNTYGYTKLAVEHSLDWYRQIHGLHFAALRYFNACGPSPRSAMPRPKTWHGKIVPSRFNSLTCRRGSGGRSKKDRSVDVVAEG
jgi:UDP-glucose 4-epimerase